MLPSVAMSIGGKTGREEEGGFCTLFLAHRSVQSVATLGVGQAMRPRRTSRPLVCKCGSH